jgi:hypothetical protein
MMRSDVRRAELVESPRILRFTVVALFLFAALLTMAWAPHPQTGSVSITGQVTNGTPDGAVPEDLAVTLHIFAEMEERDVYTTTLGTDTTFRFEDVALSEGDTLVTRALYDGVMYTSAFTSATSTAEQQAISLPITIYETTDDPGAVLISQLHVFVNQVGDRLQIGQYCLISNTGDRAYRGTVDPQTGERMTLAFELPAGGENLSFDDAGSERYVTRENGFADTRPVLPGDSSVEISFNYEIPYQEGMEVQQAFDVPVRAGVLVLPESGIALMGEGVSSEGTIDTQMGPALSYTAGPLAADEPLVFSVVSRPTGAQGGAGSGRQSSAGTTGARGIAVGLAALVAAGVAVYLMWRSPTSGPVPAHVRSQVKAIAALDADFEAGRVSEKDYGRKRRSLKREVREQLAGEQRG